MFPVEADDVLIVGVTTQPTTSESANLSERPVRKFSVKDETIQLPNGGLACRHCQKEFKVTTQAYRHFKEAHSKVRHYSVISFVNCHIGKQS